MSQRFFVDSPISGTAATLEGAEAHHLLHVMRGGVGDEVTLFDGSGAEFHARVTAVGRQHAEFEVLSRQEIDREPALCITLGVALPKGDRQRWLVEKSTELGVAELVPLETERGVAQPSDKAIERFKRAVVEASKQCGRNRLMKIAGPASVTDFCSRAGEDDRLVAHPAGESAALQIATADIQSPRVFLAIGPEGGFSGDEVEIFKSSGWRIVSLGPRILRVETAALALVAKLTG